MLADESVRMDMVPNSPDGVAARLRALLGRAGFLGLAGGVLLFGYQAGFLTMSVRLDLAVAVLAVGLLQAEFAVLSFAAFIVSSAVVFLAGSARAPSETVPGDGTVTAIVPVYRDAGVLHRSVESLRACAYDDLEILVVCEPDDARAQQRAAELAEYEDVSYVVNGNPGSKAGAINYATDLTESDYVAVFDADEVVHERFLARAVAELDEADVVQGRTVPEPTGFMESLAYYESVLLSYVARRFLYVFTDFRMAASRAVVARRSALEAVGGYDTEMLTEDFAFAYQCYRERLDVVELLDCPSRIDAAHSVRDWWGQRKRWMTGYAQVLHRLVASVRPVTDYRNLLSVGICASTVAGSLLMLTIISKFAVLLVVGSQVMFLAPVLAIVAVTLAVHLQDHRRGLVRGPSWHVLLVPLLLPVYSLSAIKAVFEYVFTWSGEWYRVLKEA
jgi:cellulose synthase/poly-beta-1,6-N-acetylglucosamine synthase-like glycosyltransferase